MTTDGSDRPDGTDRADDARDADRVLDPANLEAERYQYAQRLGDMIAARDDAGLAQLAAELSAGDLSEILRPFSVADTVHVLRQLTPAFLAEVLAEIDNRSTSAFLTLLDHAEIAEILEEMPSDEATDVIGSLDSEQQELVLAAMDADERAEVVDLLQYGPETAGGLMGKEVLFCRDDQTCGEAVMGLRAHDEDELEEMHFVFVTDERGHLVGRVPLFRLLLTPPATPILQVMEPDPLYVHVDLDQEEVAQFMMTHDLITLPVVDHRHRLVGRITADDVLDVLEEEATEDISRMAGVSVAEFGEQSSTRVARSRLPWLLGGLAGQFGAILVMQRFEQSLTNLVALAFFIPAIMAMAGNVGIQTSSVVVRGLATGEVDYFHLGRHLLRELFIALLLGSVIGACLFGIGSVVVGNLSLAVVLGLSMLLVIIFAATVGTGVPLLLHRLGIDPAVATGPFITTANDVFGLLIYLGLATLMLSLRNGGGP
ncbi:MAG: magnesium transporter [Candidatus Krumholzibacteria bacterium]|nr:magnesium transporter [Candidatus Krumholzibacteria bacterium]